MNAERTGLNTHIARLQTLQLTLLVLPVCQGCQVQFPDLQHASMMGTPNNTHIVFV